MLTTTLRNGMTVLAKQTKYGVFAYTFANLTQAEKALERNQIPAHRGYVRQFGRPFFVVVTAQETAHV